MIVFGLIAVLVYHTLRQLSMVSRIHAMAENVNLSLAAVACFVLSLRGMHERIIAEKLRLRAEANRRLGRRLRRYIVAPTLKI